MFAAYEFIEEKLDYFKCNYFFNRVIFLINIYICNENKLSTTKEWIRKHL